MAHPALLPLLASADVLVAARFAGPRSALDRFAAAHEVVPMHYQPVEGSSDWALIGICAGTALADAVLRRLSVVPLDYDPAVDDLVWARVDDATEPTRAGLADRRIVFAERGQALVALGPDESSEALRLHGAHGHTELLPPDPGLLQPARTEVDPDVGDIAFAGPSPILEEVVVDEAARRAIEAARPQCVISTKGYPERLDRYTGVAALDAAGPVVSRHIAHPDNKRVEAQLLADLREMGYCPWRHDFLHNGVTHSNIIADLPGNGRFRIKPDLLERLREILAGEGGTSAGLLAELRSLAGGVELAGPPAAELPEPALRRELERIVALEPWNPWWRLMCPMAGVGAGLVIVGGHLDSTAGFEPGYDPTTDPAPGRDDNGSGLAAVLTLAKHFRRLAGKLTHTIRFCFFNAEEAGLIGSKAYAAQLKAQQAPVRAVFCTDMMGYNSDDKRIFELHAGYTDPAIRDLSVPLANQVAAAAASTGALLPAQIYRGTGYSGAPDRDMFDGGDQPLGPCRLPTAGVGRRARLRGFLRQPGERAGSRRQPELPPVGRPDDRHAFARAITCAIGRAATLVAL